MRKAFYLFLLFQFTHLSIIDAQRNEYWLNSGDLSLRQNELQIALKNYNFHIENNPDDPIGYLKRARLYEAIGRKSESYLDIQVAERLNPLSLMIVNPAMRSKYSAKKSYGYDFQNLDEAFIKSPSKLKEYKSLLDRLSLEHSQDSLLLDVIYEINSMNLDNAESLLLQIRETTLNQALKYDLAGKIQMKRMNYDQAIENFSKAIESDSLFAIAYHNRSICYKLKGQYQKAEADLDQAISINDNISLFYFTYAKLNERKGTDQAALEYYSKALEIDEDYAEALVNYSQLLKGLGEYEEGLKYLNKAIGQSPNKIENKFHKANLHFVYANYEQAISEYDSFLDEHPQDADALFNKGLSMILMRRTPDGCQEIESSLVIKDSDKRRNLFNMFCDL